MESWMEGTGSEFALQYRMLTSLEFLRTFGGLFSR